MGQLSKSTQTRGGLFGRKSGLTRGVKIDSLVTRHRPSTGTRERTVIGGGANADLPVLPSERLQPTKRPVYRIGPVIPRTRRF